MHEQYMFFSSCRVVIFGNVENNEQKKRKRCTCKSKWTDPLVLMLLGKHCFHFRSLSKIGLSFTYQLLLSTASPKPGVSTVVRFNCTPFSLRRHCVVSTWRKIKIMIIYTVEAENYSHCQTENHFSERQPVFKKTIYKLNQIPKLFNHIDLAEEL